MWPWHMLYKLNTSMKQEVVSERLTVRSGLHQLWIWRRTSERPVVREPDQFPTLAEMWTDVSETLRKKLRESRCEQGRVCDSRARLKCELLQMFSQVWSSREQERKQSHPQFLVNWPQEVAEVAISTLGDVQWWRHVLLSHRNCLCCLRFWYYSDFCPSWRWLT